MASNIIIINGYAGAGKDTFVKFVADKLKMHGGEVINLSSITPIWELLRDHLVIPMDNKSPKERKLAADVKAALDDYDFFATQMVLSLAAKYVDDFTTVFIHMREPRAIEYSVKWWDENTEYDPIRTLFIARPQLKQLGIGNVADDSVNDYHYDHIINNNKDLTELSIKAHEFAKILLS